MPEQESIALTRDVNAIIVPDGIHTTLKKDEVVTIMQSLGGTYTVTNESGVIARISAIDADALGKEVEVIHAYETGTDPESIRKAAWDFMRTVYDPEIPVNVVDLGLIYDCAVRPLTDGLSHVHIKMTLTAPGCGMGPVIQADIESGLKRMEGVESVEVEVVLDPPWNQHMMSEAAKLQLGMI
ncbi:MAG: putative Fe-S cluster assembly protein SufT [Cycloclasticus sp. symbiont of Poecilosclerida sp. M]|nr:MAG: putative Fe-S cluster assembly protein SufT [Cycloclasticus sp. symbiont of Poecilosclerida sp. M]